MIKLRIITLAVIAAMTFTNATAQKKVKAKKVQKPKVEVVEKTAADILFEEMLPSTARILFVDSLVADKDSFIYNIVLGKDAGTIRTCDEFFASQGHENAFVYINSFNNRIFYAENVDSTGMQLYTSDRLGEEWSQPQQVDGLGQEFKEITSPFMMPDGTTLYFAAKNEEEGLGGYDIYVTRYDAESGKFYKPENIGLPYNSKANDYFYAIDEMNELGWLVTDRNQPEGKVCIYNFVPPTSRQTYKDYDDEKLQKMADIASIKDTWTDENARKKALERIKSINTVKKDTNDDSFEFVINDQKTYTRINEFKSPAIQKRFSQLLNNKKELEKNEQLIEKMRDTYPQMSGNAKRNMANEILKMEKQIEELREIIHKEEKEIRRAEQ